MSTSGRSENDSRSSRGSSPYVSDEEVIRCCESGSDIPYDEDDRDETEVPTYLSEEERNDIHSIVEEEKQAKKLHPKDVCVHLKEDHVLIHNLIEKMTQQGWGFVCHSIMQLMTQKGTTQKLRSVVCDVCCITSTKPIKVLTFCSDADNITNIVKYNAWLTRMIIDHIEDDIGQSLSIVCGAIHGSEKEMEEEIRSLEDTAQKMYFPQTLHMDMMRYRDVTTSLLKIFSQEQSSENGSKNSANTQILVREVPEGRETPNGEMRKRDTGNSALHGSQSSDLPGSPLDLSVISYDGCSCTLKWNHPSNSDRYPPKSYSVEKKEAGYDWHETYSCCAKQTSMSIFDIPKGTAVQFRVRAVNDAGMGKPSNTTPTHIVRDAISPPGQPRDLIVSAFDTFSCTLEWKPPLSLHDSNSIVKGYILEMREMDNDWHKTSSCSATTMSLSVYSVKEGTTVQFRVRAVNDAGPGEPSSTTPPHKVRDPIYDVYKLTSKRASDIEKKVKIPSGQLKSILESVMDSTLKDVVPSPPSQLPKTIENPEEFTISMEKLQTQLVQMEYGHDAFHKTTELTFHLEPGTIRRILLAVQEEFNGSMNLKEPWKTKTCNWTAEEEETLRKENLLVRKDSMGKPIKMNILIFGQTGHGKSTLCNGFRSALSGKGHVSHYHQTSSSGVSGTFTKGVCGALYGDHLCILDMSGIYESKLFKDEDITNILSGKVPFYEKLTEHLEVIDKENMKIPEPGTNDVSCVVLVVKPGTEFGPEVKRLMGIVEKLTRHGAISRCLVITHLDKVDDLFINPENLPQFLESGKVQRTVKELSNKTGIPVSATSIVRNYYNESTTNMYSNILLLTILDHILFLAQEDHERKIAPERMKSFFS